MQRRTLVVLALLFLGLLAYVMVVEVGREEEREAEKAKEEQVLPIDADGVSRITLDGDKGRVGLERRGEGEEAEWFLVEPYEAPADPAAARGLARAAATLQELRLLDEPSTDMSQYGLDEPVLRITLVAEGLEGPAELGFGGETGAKDGRYLRIEGDPGVRIAPAHQYRSLDKGIEDLRDRRLVRFSPGAATRITLTRGGESVSLERVDGVWRLAGEAPYRAARADVDDLLAELTTTRAKRFLDADDPELGLLDSTLWIEVALEESDPVRVDFGRQDADTIIAQVRGSDEAAELSAMVVRTLDRTPEQWRSQEVADINPWQVSELRFSYRDRSFELLEDEDEKWTLAEGDAKPVSIDAPWARELLAAVDRASVLGYFEPGADPGSLVGDFEIVTDGRPRVAFTLHQDGAAWVATVNGDPSPVEVSPDLAESLDVFLEDPTGTEE